MRFRSYDMINSFTHLIVTISYLVTTRCTTLQVVTTKLTLLIYETVKIRTLRGAKFFRKTPKFDGNVAKKNVTVLRV